jgi:hypothetical protein
MVEINETNLVFACPEVDEGAILRVHFYRANSPGHRIRIEPVPGGDTRQHGGAREEGSGQLRMAHGGGLLLLWGALQVGNGQRWH